jgi:peroxiredoxin
VEQEIWQAYKNKGVQVLGLAVSERQSDPNINPIAKIKEFRARHHLTYPLLSDEDNTVFGRFNGSSIPSCVLVDRQGGFVAKIDADVEAVKQQIARLVNSK